MKRRKVWRLSAEPIPAPVNPILFTMADWQAWIDTDKEQNFDAYMQERNNRTLTEVREQDNVSESTAYRKTKNKRKSDKMAQKAQAKSLHEQEAPVSDIVKIVGIGRKTFYRWKENNFE